MEVRKVPRGDRTGPWGHGPSTGRGAGYCGGYGSPGSMNPYGGRGPGAGAGFGFGWGPRAEAYGYGEPPYDFYGPPGPGFGRGFGMGRGFGRGLGMWRGGGRGRRWGFYPSGW